MHAPTDFSETRDRRVRRALVIEGLANVFVLLIKVAVGISTGSLAIMGDALHSLADAANNLVGYFVVRHSALPADDDHPYGHRKFETLAVFFLATLLAVLAVELAMRAFSGEREAVVSGPIEFAVMLIVLAINVGVSGWEYVQGKRLDSDILKADAQHTFADALTTVAVIIGWQVAARGYAWVDQVTAILVAAIVAWFAIGLFKRALPVLLDEAALDADAVGAVVQEVSGVRGVKRIRSRWVGQHASADLVILVDPALDLVAAHRICDAVEEQLEAQFDLQDVTVHVEPDDPFHRAT